MSTTKPRITITLEPHRHELLRRLSEYQGTSMSAIVVELVDTVAPVLERVCVAIESARQAQQGALQGLKRAAQESEAALMPHLHAVMGQLDIFLEQCAAPGDSTSPGRELEDGARALQGAGSASNSELENPRPVITGVRSPQPPTPQPPSKPKKGTKSASRKAVNHAV